MITDKKQMELAKEIILARVQIMVDELAKDPENYFRNGSIAGALAVLRDLVGETWEREHMYKGVSFPYIRNVDDGRVIVPTFIVDLVNQR